MTGGRSQKVLRPAIFRFFSRNGRFAAVAALGVVSKRPTDDAMSVGAVRGAAAAAAAAAA